MAGRLSRRKIAEFAADGLLKGAAKTKVLQQVAAYLVETRRTRELELLVRDIEAALALRGVVVADITSAHPVSDLLKKEIASLVKADTLQLRESIDPSVLGGVRIDLPSKRFDSTIQRQLTSLKAKQL